MFRVELFRVNPITDQANQATNQANQDFERLDRAEEENVLRRKKYLMRQGSSQKGKWLILTKRD